MYGRMQFADFVVSQALQLNTECLRTLAETGDGPLADKDLRRIRADVQRLASLWQMMHWSVGKSTYLQGRQRTDRALKLLPEGSAWVDRAVRQIGGKSDDQRRLRALAAVAEQVTTAVGSPVLVDDSELARIFQEESECWRDDPAFHQVQDSDLLDHGVVRAYEKSRRLCAALAARPDSRKRLRRARRWLRHCANHVELLQPGLSDTSKGHVWYLERLQANIEKQFVVERFVALVDKSCADGSVAAGKALGRVRKMAAARTERLQSRSNKLMVGAFEPSMEEFSRAVGVAVRKLALQEIVLLPLPGQSPPQPETGPS